MKNSAIILAGGFSKRFGRDKGLIELARKPLVLHVVDKTSAIVDEIVVVVSSNIQRKKFQRFLNHRASVIVDEQNAQSPLVGALTGFGHVQGNYSLLLPCDTPFVSAQVAQLLLDLCVGKSAAVPRWPNGYVEPLQATYHAKSAYKATKIALEEGKFNLRSMLAHLSGIRYISTTVLKTLDPRLMTFFNINMPEDLKKAEYILK